MKKHIIYLIFLSLLACETKEKTNKPGLANTDWISRKAAVPSDSLLDNGSTYLSIYSQINSFDFGTKQGLTVTVSMRNIYDEDTLYISGIRSYDTDGHLMTNYIENTIDLRPLETLEIIIDEEEEYGGSGGNFIFDWYAKEGKEPLFEAVMIRSSGQQGISFTTQGVRRY
jgi:hypothetical protein